MSELLLHRFERYARSTPQQLAVQCDDVHVSYAELNERADALARGLLAGTTVPGDLVGLCCEPGVPQIVGMLGILKAGCAWVPLDAVGAPGRVADIVRMARLQVVLTSGTAPESLQDIACDIGEFEADGRAGEENLPVVDGGQLCYVMFTSGSTGEPNGVMVEHRNVANLFEGLQEELGFVATDRWSSLHAHTFGFSVWETWGALSTGATLQILSQAMRRDPASWFAAVESAAVSVLSLTPSGFRQLLAADCLPSQFQHLRLIVFSGEAVNEKDIEQWYSRYGAAGPRLVNTYALTETAGRITWHEYQPGATHSAGGIGRPVADAGVYLLDGDMQPVAGGASGELWISGPMLARGYLNDADLTRVRYVATADGRRLYRTGDFARCTTEGEFIFTGRADHQVKLRGYRIELDDIERTLKKHPQVADAAVVLQGEGPGARLAAFIVPAKATDAQEVEFWPSLGEYQIYDELLYDFMSADETRVGGYRRAFERQAAGKVVLDIGTGKDAILARLAAAAGARKVYAVEVLPDACANARQLVERLGLADRIEVLEGDMQQISLPEPVDIVTQGIIGNIGSSDGIAPIWNDARRYFAADAAAIPSVCSTLIAPAGLPAEIRSRISFSPLAAGYAEAVFAQAGTEFDVRLCVRNFPQTSLLAAPAEFERLDFATDLPTDYSGKAEFELDADGRFDGCLLWTKIDFDASESVDFLVHQQAWLPVWLPLTDTPVELAAGDSIELEWSCTTPAGQIFPDYRVGAKLHRAGQAVLQLEHTSRHFETAHRQTALHRQLLDSIKAVDQPAEKWLSEQLPAHMQPSAWNTLAQLPLNANDKVDRQALSAVMPEPQERLVDNQLDSLERAVTAVWCIVLERASVSPDVDFFEAGGDSILAVRLTTEIQRLLDDAVFLAALFDAPTVRSYAAWLREHHAEAVSKMTGGGAAARALPVAGPRDGSSVVLATPQQSLWFLSRLYPEHTGANEQFLIRMTGKVEPERVRQAWQSLLARHDILRTIFVTDTNGADAAQRAVDLSACVTGEFMPMRSLAGMTAQAAEAQLEGAAAIAINEPFDLARAPLLRTALYAMPADETVLLVTAHHIIADGMCVQLIRDELAAAYAGEVRPEPALQYADFARYQRDYLATADAGGELVWWQNRLAGHHGQPTSLVQMPAGGGGREARFAFSIDAELADRLRGIARDAGATPFMLLLAAWRVWLARCLLEKDLLLGSPVTLRKEDMYADMLGCMVNNVVFRNPVRLDDSFLDALAAERDGALEALAHSDVPFERVVEAVQPERIPGRHPLFQLMFLFEDRSATPARADGCEFIADVLPVDRASYWDLELSLTDRGPGQSMPGFIGVRRDVYDAAALSWWPEGFVSLLRAIAVDPAVDVSRLPLLSDRQRQQMLVEWNSTRLAVDPAATLDRMVFAQAERTPDAIAVQAAGRSVSYRELIALAEAFAAGLYGRGVRHGDRVGVALTRGIESIALQLAILRCGAAWLPLDPAYPAARLEMMREAASPRLVVHAGQETFAALDNGILVAELQASGTTGELPPTAGDDVAYVLFTSGSTAMPKGVLATHTSAVSRCRWMWEAFGFSTGDIFGQRTSLNFVDSVWEIFGALGHGATVNVLPAAAEQDPVQIVHWLKANDIAHMAVVPSLLRAMLEVCAEQGAPAGLHTLISSGESLSRELAQEVHRTLPGCRLLNTYGTSETWDVSCYEVLPDEVGTVPVGRPVANASLCILDAQLQPVPPGVAGEVFAGGAGLARGYLGSEELTTSRFIDNPLKEIATKRLYRTGDTARFRADGVVELLGRSDRQIKLRGVRIEAAEIEAHVTGRDDVAAAAVILRQADGRDDWLALYVVPADGAADVPDAAAIREYLSARLPRSCVPADMQVLERLPLTPSGKVDVAALPHGDARPLTETYAAPRTELERQLAEIWSEALAIDRVGIYDNFFALRGHSLLATRVIARIADALQIEVPLQSFFERPTVAGLAQVIDALDWASAGARRPDDADGEREVVRL